MYTIQSITASPSQIQSFTLDDGSSFQMELRFRPMQYGWFIESLTYLTFTLQGKRIVNSPNFLNQFCNQLPFGLACISTTDREPTLLQDFATGASTLYLLTAAEVTQYLEYLQNGG